MVTPSPAAEASFEDQARKVISRLKRSVADIVDALPVRPATGPTELGRTLQVDTKLAWKITNLLERTDPFEAGLYVPGAQAMKRFFAAAAALDAPSEFLDRAQHDCAEFDHLVREHAGDRRSLDMMLAGQVSTEHRTAQLEHQKNAHRANSYLWGVQALMQLKTVIVAPSKDPLRLDAIVLNGFVDLRRIRPRAPWRIASAYSVDDDGNVNTGFDWSPLDADLAVERPTDGPPLVREFCSANLPEIETLPGEAGAVQYAFREGPVGRRGAITCVIGEVLRAVEPRYRAASFEVFGTYLRLHTPVEVAVLDVIVHRSLFEQFAPTAHLFSGLYSGELFKRHLDCDELPLFEHVEPVGAAGDVAWLPEMPRYRELIRGAMERLGWDPVAFDIHRIRMAFPPTPTALVIREDLPLGP